MPACLLVGIIIFWSILITGLFIVNMPHNPLSASMNISANMGSVLPEGWAFFTRNPREDKHWMYQKSEEGYQQVIRPISSPQNYFGFSRKGRAVGTELGAIMQKVQHETMYFCEDKIDACYNWDTIPSIKVLNSAYAPAFCGVYLLAQKPLVPWAWSSAPEPIQMDAQVLKIDLLCVELKH